MRYQNLAFSIILGFLVVGITSQFVFADTGEAEFQEGSNEISGLASNNSLDLLEPDLIGVTFFGNGGYSADGAGVSGSGQLLAEVPPGSTVEQAYLYSATHSYGGNSVSVNFDGTNYVLNEMTNSDYNGCCSLKSFKHTSPGLVSQVKAKIGGGSNSPIVFPFTEVSPSSSNIDGVGLVVIFSNPAYPENSIAILDGGLAVSPPQQTIVGLAKPLDKTIPNFSSTLSLGIGFSYPGADHACYSGQTSRVDVNGERLTTCAGGADDGFDGNGGLFTIGGVGDDLNNPPNPFGAGGTDDELYNISGFLNQGDTQIELVTENFSSDDIVFLAIIQITAQVSVGEICGDGIDNDEDGFIDEGCQVEPNPITEVHCDVDEAETSIELLYESEDLNGLTFEVDGVCAIHRGDGEPEFKDAIINVTKSVPDFVIPESNDVDLGGWTEESFANADWEVQDMGFTVLQKVNGDPTYYYSPFNAFNTQFAGQIKVETTGDDDFIGFALGFQPGDTTNENADYLLVDWKQNNQGSACGTALKGLAVSRVSGIPDGEEFWCHSDFNGGNAGSLTELARGNNLGNIGWADNTTYEFEFVFTQNRLQVYVDGELEIDIEGNFEDGRIAFYNFSQSFVRYSGFNVSPIFDETGIFTIKFLDETPAITITEEGTIIADPDGPTFGIDGKITSSDINPQCGDLSFIATAVDGFEYSIVDIGSIWLMACPDEPISKKNGGGDNQWDKRPTFGVNHEDRETQIVENGFRFNNEQFTITDNFWTPFEEREVEIGTTNTFAAKVYADKGLWIQEFLFGIPKVGEGHLAELNVEVWYNRDGDIDDVKVVQKTDVIDADTISVSHEKTKCLSTDSEPLCDTTTVSMTFLEPLKDKVMAIGAIDWERRSERTNLNEGFDISGESLNPMQSKMIPSNVKNAGLLEVTQVAKYSPYWKADNGRIFEMNEFGSFTEINQKFERFQDSGNASTRLHSGFGAIVEYEKNRAAEVFDASVLISELPDSFGHHIVMKERMSEEMKQHMQLQEQLAKGILEQMDKQNRYY